MKRTSIALVIFSLWASMAAGEIVLAADEPPPVTKVVLYKHGMGYLEREGKVKGNAMLSLAFRAEQMKDLSDQLLRRGPRRRQDLRPSGTRPAIHSPSSLRIS